MSIGVLDDCDDVINIARTQLSAWIGKLKATERERERESERERGGEKEMMMMMMMMIIMMMMIRVGCFVPSCI